MLKKIKRYFKIWWIMSRNSFSMVLSQKTAITFFLSGKIIRFIFFLIFLNFLLVGSKSLAGYSVNQTIFFFLNFNLVDVISQFLFREVYRFRPKVVTGDFDLILVKPVNSLFTVLLGGADIMDLVTIPPLVIATIHVGNLLSPTLPQIFLFLLLMINALVISTSFYIALMAIGIITLEIDNTIMVYRDMTSLGRFPIDILKQPIQGVLTYLIPVGIMMSYPAKAMMGLLSIQGILSSFAVGFMAIYLSLKFWNISLRKYTSASS